MKLFRFGRKNLIGFAGVFFLSVANGQNLPLQDLGERIPTNALKLRWDAKGAKLPKSVWVYTVAPTDFSASAVSNLMQIGNLRLSDRTRSTNPAFNKPGDQMFKSGGRELGVFPSLGVLEYSDPKSDDMMHAESVPSEKETTSLGLDWLNKLGIKQADLERESGTRHVQIYHEQRTAVITPTGQNEVTNIHLRGVFFARAVDGIPVFGKGTRGGVLLEFGNHAKLVRCSLLWRQLVKKSLRQVASPDEILEDIRAGKCVYQSPDAEGSIDWDKARRITIIGAKAYYYGEPAYAAQVDILPFAILDADVATQTGKHAIHILCPLIKN